MRAVAQRGDEVLVLTNEAAEEGVVVNVETGVVTGPMSVHTPLRSGGWGAATAGSEALLLAEPALRADRAPPVIDTRGFGR